MPVRFLAERHAGADGVERGLMQLLGAGPDGHPYAYMDPAQWREFTGWMRDNELIASLPDGYEVLLRPVLVRRSPAPLSRSPASSSGPWR